MSSRATAAAPDEARHSGPLEPRRATVAVPGEEERSYRGRRAEAGGEACVVANGRRVAVTEGVPFGADDFGLLASIEGRGRAEGVAALVDGVALGMLPFSTESSSLGDVPVDDVEVLSFDSTVS